MQGVKVLGCAVVHDGACRLPRREGARSSRAPAAGGDRGSARLVAPRPADEVQEEAGCKLFGRGAAYARLCRRARSLRPGVSTASPAAASRGLGAQRREVDASCAIDFFAGAAHAQARPALEQAERSVLVRHASDEPHATAGSIPRCERRAGRRRLWATRKHRGVDRLACAWLLERFIDRSATFGWRERPRDRPARAVGFDFDGAAFTHSGDRVTFEVLLGAFQLEADAALARIGLLVHFLDQGGVPVADAEGVKTGLRGAPARSDDRLLRETMRIFDLLYSAYRRVPDGR